MSAPCYVSLHSGRVLTELLCRCILQLSLFQPGREALNAHPGVIEALDALVDKAWAEETKDFARGALMQLTGQQVEVVVDTDDLHIMVSCTCATRSRMPAFSVGWWVFGGEGVSDRVASNIRRQINGTVRP
eukprot:COSAG02_NODE_4797_length_4965_cov_30.380395_2_plen_131_part_00